MQRIALKLVWLLFASWTPRQFNSWRIWLLRAFGAKLSHGVVVRSSVKIWWPGNLTMEEGSTLGPDVICYNMAPIRIGRQALISQRAELCTGTHSISDPAFCLITKPIVIGPKAWVAANAFVGPGVTIGEGAILGACAVTASDLDPWMVYVGNPAKPIKKRIMDVDL